MTEQYFENFISFCEKNFFIELFDSPSTFNNNSFNFLIEGLNCECSWIWENSNENANKTLKININSKSFYLPINTPLNEDLKSELGIFLDSIYNLNTIY